MPIKSLGATSRQQSRDAALASRAPAGWNTTRSTMGSLESQTLALIRGAWFWWLLAAVECKSCRQAKRLKTTVALSKGFASKGSVFMLRFNWRLRVFRGKPASGKRRRISATSEADGRLEQLGGCSASARGLETLNQSPAAVSRARPDRGQHTSFLGLVVAARRCCSVPRRATRKGQNAMELAPEQESASRTGGGHARSSSRTLILKFQQIRSERPLEWDALHNWQHTYRLVICPTS